MAATTVVAGPVEATVIGNALVQLITLDELTGIDEARQLVAGMKTLARYEPQATEMWDEAYHDLYGGVERRPTPSTRPTGRDYEPNLSGRPDDAVGWQPFDS